MNPHLGILFRQLLDKHGERCVLVAIRKMTGRAPDDTDDSYIKRLNGLILVLGTYFKTRCGPTIERSKIAYCVGYNATDIFEATIFGQANVSQRRLTRMLLAECVIDGMLNNDDPQASSWLFLKDEFGCVCGYISRMTGVSIGRVKGRLLEYLMST
jgi:hypothetical protein